MLRLNALAAYYFRSRRRRKQLIEVPLSCNVFIEIQLLRHEFIASLNFIDSADSNLSNA